MTTAVVKKNYAVELLTVNAEDFVPEGAPSASTLILYEPGVADEGMARVQVSFDDDEVEGFVHWIWSVSE